MGRLLRVTPRIAGVLFFYWWQLLWLVITVVMMAGAYLLVRGEK